MKIKRDFGFSLFYCLSPLGFIVPFFAGHFASKLFNEFWTFLITGGSFAFALLLVLKVLDYHNHKHQHGEYGVLIGEDGAAEVLYKGPSGSFTGATFAFTPRTFKEAKEVDCLFIAHTEDGMQMDVGFSLPGFHVAESSEDSIQKLVAKHGLNIPLEEKNINEAMKKIKEESAAIIKGDILKTPYASIHAHLPRIFESARKELEEKHPLSIRIKAYYY